MSDEYVSHIDTVNWSLLRDREAHARVFWRYDGHRAAEIWKRGLGRFCVGNWVSCEDAQQVLRPWIDDFLSEIALLCSQLSKARWLVLIRGSSTRVLDRFLRGPAFPILTPSDKFNVLRMMTLAGVEYGNGERYFEPTESIAVDTLQSLSGTEWISKLEAHSYFVPDTEIVALRELLDLCAQLLIVEKWYRSAGRGMQLCRTRPDQLVVGFGEHSEAIALYDHRVSEHYAQGGYLADVGVPSILQGGSDENSCLFGMVLAKPESWIASMEAIRERYPDEFNPFNYFPTSWELRDIRDFFRRFPKPIESATGGLSPDELFACIWALGRIVVTQISDQIVRCWLGCFGILPLKRHQLHECLCSGVKTLLAGYPPSSIEDTVGRFLSLLSPIRVPQEGHFDSSSVHRYMTASAILPVLERDDVVLIDYVYLVADLRGWITDTVLANIHDSARGKSVFEEWLRAIVKGLKEEITEHSISEPRQGLNVRTNEKDPLTDVDLTIAIGEWLFLIQCKNRRFRDEHFRGESKAIEHRWRDFDDDLHAWDRKMKTLFDARVNPNWAELNPELFKLAKGCTRAIPILVTPRPEWIPTISTNYILRKPRPGDPEKGMPPILRICTFAELKRLISLGGPALTTDVDWVIPIGNSN